MKIRICNLFLLAGMLTVFASCTKDDMSPDGSDDISPAEVAATLSKGEWVITYFFDSDKDETAHFSGYIFQFEDGGKLKATKGDTVISGTWSNGTDDSQTKLYINFSSPDDFEELSDDWHVLERSDKKIRLEDVSGGNGGTDWLTFEKQ